MIILGEILFIIGGALCCWGSITNQGDYAKQWNSRIGTSFEEKNGDSFLVFGVLLIVAGLALFIAGAYFALKKKNTSMEREESRNILIDKNTGNWECPKCGKYNSSFTYWCTCGGKKPTQKSAQIAVKAINDNEWKCSNCGRVNYNYVGTCACGETILSSKKKETEYNSVVKKRTEEKVDKIFCRECGAKLQSIAKFCKKCGTKVIKTEDCNEQ